MANAKPETKAAKVVIEDLLDHPGALAIRSVMKRLCILVPDCQERTAALEALKAVYIMLQSAPQASPAGSLHDPNTGFNVDHHGVWADEVTEAHS